MTTERLPETYRSPGVWRGVTLRASGLRPPAGLHASWWPTTGRGHQRTLGAQAVAAPPPRPRRPVGEPRRRATREPSAVGPSPRVSPWARPSGPASPPSLPPSPPRPPELMTGNPLCFEKSRFMRKNSRGHVGDRQPPPRPATALRSPRPRPWPARHREEGHALRAPGVTGHTGRLGPGTCRRDPGLVLGPTPVAPGRGPRVVHHPHREQVLCRLCFRERTT